MANVKEIDDLYALSVAAYALQLAAHPSRTEMLELLVSKSITKGESKLLTWKGESGSDCNG